MQRNKKLTPEEMAQLGALAATAVDESEAQSRHEAPQRAPFSTQGRQDSRVESREQAVAFHSRVVEIDTARIQVSAANERDQELLTEDSCAALIADIQKNGQHQPAEVITDPANREQFLLISGSRRLFAARHLGRRLLAIVLPPGRGLDLREQIERSRAENDLHSKPYPIEICRQAARFVDQKIVTSQDELAGLLGLKKSTISERVQAGRLNAEVLRAIAPDLAHLTVRLAYQLANSGHSKGKLLSIIKRIDKTSEAPLEGAARVRAIVDAARGKSRGKKNTQAWKRLGDGVEWKLKQGSGKPELLLRLPVKYRKIAEEDLERLLGEIHKALK